MRKIERIFMHCTVSPLSRGLHRCDAVGGKPLGMARCGADRDGDGVCDIIYPIKQKEYENE